MARKQDWRDARKTGKKMGVACQQHSGTRIHRCGCSLPGLTGFTVYRCEGTNRTTITTSLTGWALTGTSGSLAAPPCGLNSL